MPKDGTGRFHLSSQRANAFDRAATEKKPPAPKAPAAMGGGGESPQGGAHEHLAAMHAESGGKHMHVHQGDSGFTSHHVGHDGQVEGPHEHGDLESLKSHMDQFFDGESQEGEGHSLEHQMATGHEKDVY